MAAVDQGMTSAALAKAKLHVYNVCQDGFDIKVLKPASASAKDELGTVISSTSLDLKAFPIRFSPFDRRTTERITWAENVDLIAYVSKLEVDGLSVTLKQLKNKYDRLRYDGKTYDLKYVEHYNAFANDWLYIIFGATK
jgi:hypothetical protein